MNGLLLKLKEQTVPYLDGFTKGLEEGQKTGQQEPIRTTSVTMRKGATMKVPQWILPGGTYQFKEKIDENELNQIIEMVIKGEIYSEDGLLVEPATLRPGQQADEEKYGPLGDSVVAIDGDIKRLGVQWETLSWYFSEQDAIINGLPGPGWYFQDDEGNMVKGSAPTVTLPTIDVNWKDGFISSDIYMIEPLFEKTYISSIRLLDRPEE